MKTSTVAQICFAACLCTYAALAFAQATEEETTTDKLQHVLAEIEKTIPDTPSPHHHIRAEILFRLGRFEEAILDYEKAVEAGLPHDEDSCWERGLAQYYAGDFTAGRDQFTAYHRVGTTDIENGLWRFLCIAEVEGIEKARETMLSYPRKRREPFPALLALYMGEGSAEAVLKAAEEGLTAEADRTTNFFFAHYYLGKYYEIMGDDALALVHVRKALDYEFSHFMYACAEIDAKRLSEKQTTQ